MNYTPRKKKLPHGYMPIEGKKTVRIDARTQIEVNISVPDDVARERFLARYSSYAMYGQGTPEIKPPVDITQLATVIDDSVLPETE
jgi:hypothetical protein